MRLARYLIFVTVLVVFGLVTVWQRLELLKLGYETHELDRIAERLREENRVSESRIGRMTGPEETAVMAARLGLEPVISSAPDGGRR
jgi:hypothetical protein